MRGEEERKMTFECKGCGTTLTYETGVYDSGNNIYLCGRVQDGEVKGHNPACFEKYAIPIVIRTGMERVMGELLPIEALKDLNRTERV